MRTHKPRRTLTKEITKTAQRNDYLSTYEALEIATFGRRLTNTERAFESYYDTEANFQSAVQGHLKLPGKHPLHTPDGRTRLVTFREGLEHSLKLARDGLCEQFMIAVTAGNFQKIHELAEVVRFFKTGNYNMRRNADPERAALLSLKKRIRYESEKMTIREVAEYLAGVRLYKMRHKWDHHEYLAWLRDRTMGDRQDVNFPKVETSADGFSALRKKCREIKFPLAPSRKISLK